MTPARPPRRPGAPGTPGTRRARVAGRERPGPRGLAAVILSLDTATDFPSLALGTPAAPGPDARLGDRRALSREIERAAAGLLADRGATVRDLEAVLLADGPGSFTGLRIGAAFAKGLARALGVPLLTAPSMLGAAAAAAGAAARASPVEVEVRYDALRGECYRAVFRVAAGGALVLAAPALAAAPPASEQGFREGAARPPDALVAAERDASAAALLGLVGNEGGPAAVADPGRWEPHYGRPAEAEARRLARERGGA